MVKRYIVLYSAIVTLMLCGGCQEAASWPQSIRLVDADTKEPIPGATVVIYDYSIPNLLFWFSGITTTEVHTGPEGYVVTNGIEKTDRLDYVIDFEKRGYFISELSYNRNGYYIIHGPEVLPSRYSSGEHASYEKEIADLQVDRPWKTDHIAVDKHHPQDIVVPLYPLPKWTSQPTTRPQSRGTTPN